MKILAEQEHNKLLDTVRNLLRFGMDVAQVTSIVDITLEEVQAIQKSLMEE